MSLDFEVKLGQSTNLLTGYKADVFSVPFTTSIKPALYEKRALIKSSDYDAKWSFPTITLHRDVEHLLSAVLYVKLRPMPSEDKPSEGGAPAIWPSGALVLAGLTETSRQQALRDLSRKLGIDLSKDGWSFALVRYSRKIGTATHHCYERGMFGHPHPDQTVTPEALAALKKLDKLQKTSTDVSMDGANGYLKFYETYGSHFVSSIDAGDSIFQVFAFATPQFDNIVEVYKNAPDSLSGPTSSSFCVFTTPRNDAGYGYTAAVGNICIASGDQEMAKSLKEGLWRDDKYSGSNSILAPFLRSDSININTAFKKIVAISIELASVSVFAEYYRMLIWHRVFKAAMYVKYANGLDVAPYLGNNCPYDLNSLFKCSDPLGGDVLLSTLCTPSVNVMQEKIGLSTTVLTFPEVVKFFGVFANALQIPSTPAKDKTPTDIPGSTNVTLLSHVITSGGKGPVPPNIRLTDSAFKEIKGRLCCGEFYGGLRISNSDNSKSYVIMNGLMLEESNGCVTVVHDVRESPSLKVITERLTDMQFALVAAEARLNYLLGSTTGEEKGLELMKRFLLWLAGVSGSNYQYHKLVPLQARAMYLAKVVASQQRVGVPVPYLRYEAYKDVVDNVEDVIRTASNELTNFQNQIRARLAEERAIDREQALNENIIKSGRLLQAYIRSQASYQESLEDQFESVFKEKEKEMCLVISKTKKLESSLKEQRDVVDQAITDYQDAVADWEKKETLKAAIDIASNIFSLGFAFTTPASAIGSLVSLGETVQKIQKLVNVFNAVIKTYRSIKELPKNPQQVVDTLKDLGPEGLAMTSSLEWDEMKVNFDAVLSSGPAIGAKTNLSSAFSILVLRGKALLQCQSVIQRISADMAEARQRITLHRDQKKRLDDLKVNLDTKPKDLDAEKIDLIGLSGQLLFFQRQMLITMASIVVVQDRALQYEYLRQPTPVGSFTMLNLQLTILKQSQSINQGLTVQPRPVEQKYPIVYEIHGVKPGSMTKDHRYTFTIDVNKREFASYNYVRVQSVAVEIDGIVSTKSGKYYTELVFKGNPFFDRGFSGETLTFQTTSRLFTGLHEVKSSRYDAVTDQENVVESSRAFLATTDEDPFDNKISSITPFSTWQVSLPETPSNEDIKFDDDAGGVTIRLIFHIYAQLKETTISAPELYNRSRQHVLRRSYATVDAASVALQPTNEAYSASASRVTKNDVLSAMEGKSVCAGWDVVFSLTADEINRQLCGQYNDRAGNPEFVRETGKQISEHKSSIGVVTKTEFDFKFNAPRLQFLLNNSNSAQIYMPIISGHYEYSIKANGKWIAVENADVKESDKSYIRGDVPLGILPGSLSSQHNVAAKLKGGAFSAQNFEAGLTNPNLRSALTDYFTNLKDGYQVYNFGTIDFKGISVLESLRPSNFLFNVYHTASNRDLLQLFIATTGALQSNAVMYLKEPVPSSYDCSLIINTKIFFKDVVPASLENAKSGLALKAVAPDSDGNEDKTWSSKATAGSVTSPYPEEMVDSGILPNPSPQSYDTTYYEAYVKVANNTAVIDLTGMEFQNGDAASGWDTKMKYDVGQRDYSFQYGQRIKMCDILGCHGWSSIGYKGHSLNVSTKMSSNLPLAVTGSGQNQFVEFATTISDVSLYGYLEPPAGACKCNDRELQKKFLANLKKSVPPKLTDLFNQKFKSVSIFALKNLLFPAKNLIDMKEASVPGDMVVFGKFTSD